MTLPRPLCLVLLSASLSCSLAEAQAPRRQQAERKAAVPDSQLTFPPKLPGGKEIVTDKSEAFLSAPGTLREGVAVAKTPPTIDFMYYPGQNYLGKPWSNWGDGLAVNGKYYSAIGDHLAVGSKGDGTHGTGKGLVFEYDPATRTLRELANTAKVLNMPEGHYTPGKVHSRIDIGSDGWLYYGTHRGSSGATTDKYHYEGDWILRTHPASGKTEVVVRGPVSKHCIPNSVLDPDRLIFYGGTAAGSDAEAEGDQFFAYDCKNRKLLYSGPDGPSRYMIFARSTGRVYYVPGNSDGTLMRFDPKQGGTPVEVPGSRIGVRAATQETPDGFVYTVSIGQRSADAALWSFNTKTEETKQIGTAPVGSQAYIASIDADPSGRYLYYTAGAHGSGDRDGTPVVQYDVKTGQKKVIAFLEPFYTEKYGCTLKGTYSTAVDPAGDKLYITWNVSRGSRAWDCCGLTVIHIPESERPL
jgi:hypothetical protein